MSRFARFLSVVVLLVSVAFASQGVSQTLASNTWSSAGQMTQARSGAAAVLLTNGRVLITGGTDSGGTPQATTEIYDPATGVFTAAPSMNVPRANHAAIVLKTGDVLVTGGLTAGGGYSDSAEIYGAKSQQWTLLSSSIGSGLAYQAMAQLSDGNILIAGGTSTTKVVGSIVLYNVTAQTFTPVASLLTPRTNAVAAATPDGRVLIAGGTDMNGAVLASTEIFVYNKSTLAGTVSAGPTMTSPRVGASATSTYDGVAVIGGNNGQTDLGTAEIFSQWTNTFHVVSGGTPRSQHFAALLPNNGGILVMGGTGGTAVDLLQPWANKKAGTFLAAAVSPINQNGAFGTPASLGALLAGGGTGATGTAAQVYFFPTISTDKSDYPPGTPVKMTGTGFQPFETVNLHLHEWVDQSTEDNPDATVTVDSYGNFSYKGYAPTPKDLGARYHLTAIGAESGYQAQVIFTDGITFLNFVNAPLDQATNVCGQLTIGAGADSGGYTAVTLTDSTNTGGYYTNSSCTGTAITSFTPSSSSTNLWYKNSASGNPQLNACTQPIFGICIGIFGGASAAQTESIYGAPTQLVFAQQPGGGQPGTVWAQQPVLVVDDANFNTVAANSDPISLALSTNPGGTLVCTANPLNASSGVASFAGCTVTGAASSNACYKITATDTTLHFQTTSACFFITNAASPSNSTVVANPTTVVDNGTATSTITVTLKDSGGALLANKGVTLTANGGHSTINIVTGTTNASGVATFTVSDATAETVAYTAADTTDNVVITQTATVIFAPAAVSPTRSTVNANPTTVQADGVTTSTITVTLQDSSNDVVPGKTVTLTQGGGNSVITIGNAVTNSSGVATFTVTDTHVENVQYTATDSTDSIAISTKPTVSFTAVPTTLTLSVNPNAITAGFTPGVLTAGLSTTAGGGPVAGATINFYRGAVGSGTCNTGSTLLATFATDPTGSATYNYPTAALATGSYQICAFSTAATLSGVPYAAASSGNQTLTVGTASNFTWTTAPPASAVYNTTFTPVAHSTNSPCTVSYAVAGGACSINNGSHLVTMTSGGGLPPGSLTCTVTANLAACSQRVGGVTTFYGPGTLTQAVTPVLATPTTLVLTGVPANAGDGVTFTVGTTGGSSPGDTGAVTFSVTGICTVTGNQVTMNASSGTCTVTAHKASDGNYAAVSSASASASAGIGAETVTFANTSQTFNGGPLPVTVITTPVGGVSVNTVYTGTSLTYGPTTTPPTLVGTYSVTATITDPNYTGSGTTTETISQSSPGLVLALQTGTTNPSPYGTTAYFVLNVSTSPCPTGTVQLTVDGTAVGASQAIQCSTPIVFSTATIEPGTHDVKVQYSGDSNNAPGTSNSITPAFVVSADTTSVTLTSTTTPVFVGQTITFTATVGPTSLDPSANGPLGTIQFFDGSTPLGPPQTLSATSPYQATYIATLAQGSHSITASYLPGSDAEFAGSSSAIEVAVVQYITPTITWAAPASIVYGTALSSIQLDATVTDPVNGNSTVSGTTTYLPAANTVLDVGITTLQVSFTPTDTATYGPGPYTATVPITVTGATLTVTADPQTQVYGGPVPTLTYTITGFANGDTPSVVTGTATCSTTTTVTSGVSGSPYTNAITCLQGSLAAKDYTFTFAPGTMTVTPATPSFALSCPNVPYDNTAHSCQGSALAIGGTSQVAGNWVYVPASEIAPGSYPTTGTFTPTDTNYVGGSANGTLVISLATSSITLTCPSSVPYNGTAQTPCTATVTGSNLNQSLTSSINYTNNTNIGTATATVSYAGDADHTGSSNTVTFAISSAAATATAGSNTWVYNGNIETIPACTMGGTFGTLTCTNNPVTVGPGVGSGTVTPVVNGDTTNYTVIPTNGTWSITQAPTTVTLSCPSSVVFNGLAQTPCTVTVTSVGLSTTVPITYTNNSNVGTANASASFPGDTNHAPGSASVNFAITAAPVTVTAGSYSGIYDGSQHAPTACTMVGAYTGSLVCTDNPALVGADVGSGSVTPVLSGDTQSNYALTLVNGSWSITKATATVTVTCPSSVTYNGAAQTPCSATVTGTGLNQTLPVTYSNNTNIGTATANANYAGTIDYAATSGSATFTINPAAVTATAGSLNGVYNGAAQSPSACTISGAYTAGVTCVDSPASVGPAIGNGNVIPSVSGGANFSVTQVNGTWVIAPQPATITLGNLAQFFTGSPATPVTVTTVPSGLAVSVLYGTVGNPSTPSSATPPTAVGNYAVLAVTTNPNYAGSANGTLSISSATTGLPLVLRAGSGEPSLYGTLVYFDLTLTGSPCPTGTVTWNVDGVAQAPVTLPATCAIPVTLQTDTLLPGSHQVFAVFASGDTNFTSGTSNTVTHAVSADTSVVSLSGPSSANVAASVTFTALVQPTQTPGSDDLVFGGSVNFFDGATLIGSGTLSKISPGTYLATFSTSTLAAGPHTISATFVPTNSTEYPGSSSTLNVTISIDQIVPVITWATPGSIVYGTPLSATQLNASATDPTTSDPVPGSFTYNPALGALVPAGNINTLSATFHPTNTTIYTSPTTTVNLIVTPATPTLKLTCAAATYNGTAQQTCVGSETGVAGGATPTGTWVYSPATETEAGTYTITGTFTSTNGDYSTGGTATGSMTISKALVTATAGSSTSVYTGTAVTIPACVVSGSYIGTLVCADNPATVGPAVGAGTVTPVVSGGTASDFTVTSVNGAWSITKATSTVTVTCPASVVYNGAAQTPCTATVTGAGGLSQSLTVTYTNNTNVGTATASASFAGDANHSASTNSATFTITTAAVTATAGSFSGVYNGLAGTPSACVVTGAFKGTLVCTDNPATVGPAVGAGTITPTVSGGTLSDFTITNVNGSWSITKATSTVTVSCPVSVTYNGAAQTPCTANVTGAGGLSQALTVTYTNNTNAGTATASATFAGDTNHAGSTNSANFTIAAAAVTATAGSLTGVYTGAAQTPSACVITGAFKGALTCADNPATVGPAVGTGTVTPTVTGGSANFAITLVNGAWSITQATSTVTVTCPASVNYNGAAQTPCTATVTGAGGLNTTLTVTYTANTNAGTATATATYAGDTNHSGSTKSTNFTINAAPVTATAGSVTGVYNGTAFAPTACTITGTFKVGLSCTDNPASVGPAVGAGTVTPTVTGGSANFAITLVNGAWSITKATSTVTVTCPASVSYNGAAQTPCTATATGVGGLNQTLTVTYANNTNVGTATASATFAGDANHATATNSANFTITAAAVTATAGSLTGVYNGAAQTPSACVVTGAFKGTLVCTDNPASVGPAVGAGTVTPTVSGGTLSDFAITMVNGAWSITKATSTVTVTCPASVVYSGTAQTPCTATVTGTGGLNQTLTVTYTNNTNVGTATANASFAGDANHAASSNSATFNITASPVTATAGSLTGTYTGAAQTPSACAITGAITTGLSCTDNPATVGPAVGSGTVTPVVSGAASNFNVTLVNGAWSITLATSTVTVTCPASVVYNGAAQTPCTATVTGPGGLSQSLTVNYTNNTNAGTATANASYAGSTDYAAGTGSATFTIGASPVTATAGSLTGIYNGAAQSPSACALTGAYTVGLTCTDNPASVGPAVGSGTVTPTVTGGSANFAITNVNGAWSITKATSTVTVTCPASVLYNGAAQTPCTATVTGPGGLSQSLTVTYANNTNAGTATANAVYAGTANYAAASNSANFTVGAAPVTATAGSLNSPANGSAQSPSACTITGAYTVGLSCTDNPASVGPAVGSGTVAPVVSGGSANFNITLVNGSWNITQPSLISTVTTVTCPPSVAYNGAAQTPCTAAVTGSGGLNQTLTVSYTNNTNAGTATASASYAGNTTYAPSSNSSTFTISPAAVTATAGSLTGTYNGSAQSPSACAITGTTTGGLSCTNNPTSVGPPVGSGTVTPTVTGGSANFAITNVNGAWTITKATPTVTVTCPASVLYNGAAQSPCTATATGAGGLSQTLTVTYTNNTNAGTATANASFAGDANHAAGSNSATFTIGAAPVTATAGSFNGPADGSTHSPSACAITGAYTVGLSCIDSPASVGPAVGSGTVTPVVTGGSANFNITLVNGSWNLTQPSLTSTVTTVNCPASVGFNGTAQTPCTATVTGSGGLSQTLTVTYTNNTIAGTATANASYAGNTTYAPSSNSATFNISAAAVTATAGSLTGAYNGSAQTPSACLLTGGYTTGLSCTDNPASVGPAVGSGTITPTVTGGSANFAITLVNGAWSITQSTATVTVSCPASVIYNGAAQTPCTATATGSGGLNQTLTVTYTSNTNAGTATANASFAGDANHAAASNSATFGISAAPVTATAGSFNGPADGSTHSPSACTLTGAYTAGLSCTDNPASVGPAVGSGTVAPVVSGGTANFAITLVNGTWNINQASLTSTTTTVTCPASVIYSGAAQAPCTATVTGAGGLSQTLTVSYTNNTNAGTATASASYAGNTTYAPSNGSGSFSITSVAVTATAGSYSGAADGSAHAPSACALTGSFTGGLSCTDNPASVGPAVGSGTVAPVVSGGTANFNITLVNGSWSITQGSLTTTTTTVSCPASTIYSGAAQTPCTATVTGAGGLSQSLTVNYTNNTNTGTATASASYAGNSTYAASNGSATFTITQAPATVTLSNTTQTYTGSPLPVTVTTVPSGLNVTVLYSSGSYPSSATAPTNPGTYSVSATVVNANYTGSATGTLVISSASAGLTLQLRSGTPEPSPYGMMVYFDLGMGGTPCPTGTVQFNVDGSPAGSAITLNGASCSSPVTFQTATLAPGSHTVNAVYSGDTNHAGGTSNNVTHAVVADTTAVTLATSATTLNVGQTVTFTATITPTSLDPSAQGPAGTVQFSDGGTQIGSIALSSTAPYTAVFPTSSLTAGPHNITATYVSSDGEFTGSSSMVTVTVTSGLTAPTITWSNPANIPYGTPLGATQLNATATDPTTHVAVAGTFAYTPVAGTVVAVGTVNLSVTFTPSDATTYSTQTATVTLTVTPVASTLSLTCTEVTYDGNPHACVGAATEIDGVTAVSGSWTYSPANGTAAGSYPVTGTFTSTNPDYQGGTATGTLKIDAAPVTATAGSYTGALDGSAHAPSACAVTGAYTAGLTCTDNPASVGPAVGSGTVTPVVSGGNANFAITLINGSWSITQSSLTATTTAVSCPASVLYTGSAATPCTATVTGAGGLSQTLTVAYTNNTSVGTATATASFAGNSTYAASNGSATFTIGQASQTINFTQPTSPVVYGVSPITLSATGGASGSPVLFSIDAGSTGSGTISGNSLTVTSVGNIIIDANQAGNSNYSAATVVKRTIVVNLATLTVTANNASRVYGAPNPAFTGSMTGAVRGDTYTESYSTTATIVSSPGNYPIVPSATGADLADYTVTVQNGVLAISQAGTTTSLTASGASITPGQTVTLTAAVASVTTGTPSGSVAFYDGNTLLGTSPMTAGTATMNTSSLIPGGTNALQAVYSGDINFTPSTSSTSSVSVAPLDFTVAVTGATSQTINPGDTVAYQVMVTPLYGSYPGPVSFAVSGLPADTSVTFNPATLAAGAGQQTVTVTLKTSATSKEEAPSIGRKLAPLALAFFLIPLFGARRMRKQGRSLGKLACLLLLLVSTLAGSLMATGCGGAVLKQILQNYTVTVTTTSGNVQHTAPVTLVIK